MSEDTPGNPGVACWPDPDSAWRAVRKMQLKLHRWASEDSARRFDDLFNLVCDPAFLVMRPGSGAGLVVCHRARAGSRG